MTDDKKAKLERLLRDNFSSVYCDTCASYTRDDNDPEYCCYDCNRKAMYWKISDSTVDGLVSAITKIVAEE